MTIVITVGSGCSTNRDMARGADEAEILTAVLLSDSSMTYSADYGDGVHFQAALEGEVVASEGGCLSVIGSEGRVAALVFNQRDIDVLGDEDPPGVRMVGERIAVGDTVALGGGYVDVDATMSHCGAVHTFIVGSVATPAE
ncbi:MAG: hypothetical protein Q4G34_06125 [Micrococcus sp.]|nr:hypothetical protein [Micrococcus sp.]